MKQSNSHLMALCESAILLALGTILSLLKVFELPNGGSITFASMLPVILIGVRWGPAWGFGASFVYGFLQFLTGMHAITPLALILDYILAFAVLGFAGFFRNKKYGLIPATVICSFLRFVVHWVSGATVWAATLPQDLPIWYGSLAYNATYMLPEMIFCICVAALLCVPLQRFWLSRSAIKG